MTRDSRNVNNDLKIRVSSTLKGDVGAIAKASGCSVNACVETLLLLLKSAYEQGEDAKIVHRMLELKSAKVMQVENLGAKPERAELHLKLSSGALSFVNLLKERYPAVCGSATEAIDLSLRYWQALCADDRHLSYVVARVRGMRGDARR